MIGPRPLSAQLRRPRLVPHPPETSSVAAGRRRRVVDGVEPAGGSCTGRGPLVWPRAMRTASGGRHEGSRPSSRASTSATRDARASDRRTSGAHREPGQVPARVLAELAHAQGLAEQSAEQVGRGASIIEHDLAETGRRPGYRPAGEGVGQVPEEPRPAEAAPADDHAVAPGGRHHGQGVRRLPQVAVAQHGDRGDGLLQSADGVPVGRARVQLLGRAGVQGDGGHPLVLGDPARRRGR